MANHAKYATAHLFRPQPESASFVTMVSPHVARGRRNLAANMIVLMRQMVSNASKELGEEILEALSDSLARFVVEWQKSAGR